MKPFVYKLWQELEKAQALQKGDRVLVSLSGGPDSMALYHFLCLVEVQLELTLKVVHFNHGVRKESKEEEKFVRAETKKRGHELLCFSPLSAFTGNFQEAARHWRREVLFAQLQTTKFDKIALGHHGDDLSETILFRLLRGASLFRLQPFSIFDGPIIRPLLPLTKLEILTWLDEEKVSFVTDQSNEKTNYKRNEIRLNAFPLLNEMAGGKLNQRLGGMSDEVAELKELFESQVSPESYQKNQIEYDLVGGLPALFAKEVILRFLNHNQVYELHQSQIKEIYSLVCSGRGGWQIDVKGGIVSGEQKVISFDNK